MLCLQEMQSDAYHQHFQPHLSEKGYDGLYKAKTREGAMGKVRCGVCSGIWPYWRDGERGWGSAVRGLQ